MRFRTEAFWRVVLLSVTLVALLACPPLAQGVTGIDDDKIARAITAVKVDPNLATSQTIKMLRWRSAATAPTAKPAGLEWLTGLVRWLDQSARVLMWVLLAVIGSGIAALLVKASHGRGPIAPGSGGRAVPTHVQDLDIRPETLPDDIGLAARELWDRGDHRAALALLYRGLLSRLAHVHRLPIRDSSTEGDCLALAARAGAHAAAYSARLIATWQASVYGQAGTQATIVYGLCDEFRQSLDTRAAPLSPGDEA